MNIQKKINNWKKLVFTATVTQLSNNKYKTRHFSQAALTYNASQLNKPIQPEMLPLIEKYKQAVLGWKSLNGDLK